MFSLVDFFQDNSYNKGFDENEKVAWEGLEDFDYFFPDLKENPVQFSPNLNPTDDILHVDIDSLPFRPYKIDNTVNLYEPKREDPPFVSPASLGIIRNYTRGIKRLCKYSENETQRKLSTNEILRLSGEKFIQISARVRKMPSLALSPSEVKDVNLLQKLLSSAEKVGQKNYDMARNFLDQCDSSSSNNGNQIKRIVYYFSKALREKIDKETGKVSCKVSLKNQSIQIYEDLMKANPVALAMHQKIPLSQITVYSGMQVITERVSGAKYIHVIDLEICSGLHISILMQALSDRIDYPIELLKVTAVTTKSKWIIEETGRRLRDFAKSVNLPFLFNIIMVSDIRELHKEQFDFQFGETVAVTALYALRNLIGRQNELESLMEKLKSINPSVMVVIDIEGKHNSPVFVNRFIEALFYYGAIFDCMEDIKSRDSELRMKFESIYFGYGIRNIIVGEGGERTYRHVNLDIWRAFFARFDMREEEMSSSSLLQASLVAKTFSCWKSCTIYKDEKSLMVGWKGFPLQHVSTWRFEKSDVNLVDEKVRDCKSIVD